MNLGLSGGREHYPPRYALKVLNPGRMPIYGLPVPWPELGEWTPPQLPRLCIQGWHLTFPHQLGIWLPSWDPFDCEIYVAEVARGAAHECDRTKLVVSQARLVHRLPWNQEVWSRAKKVLGNAHYYPYQLRAVRRPCRDLFSKALCAAWGLKRRAKPHRECCS